MIEVSEALDLVMTNTVDPGVEVVPIDEATGRVLRENLFADSDFPPFDRVMMDGVAIRYGALDKGLRHFKVVATQAAGDPPLHLDNDADCIEIMTGAVNPPGADAVIPYEDLVLENGLAEIKSDPEKVGRWMNIHKKGTDKQRGDLLVPPGCRLEGPEIAIAAAIGKTTLSVSRLPRIAIVSSGNELVEIDRVPRPHEIRRSNVYAIDSELRKEGLNARLYHMADDTREISSVLTTILHENDVILLSGGVSKGKFDYIPGVLDALGIKKLFHRINQKPGKPFWFGIREQKAVFAFPGNPVSTFLCYHKYFKPWLHQSLQATVQNPLMAILEDDFRFPGKKTYFLQVQVQADPSGRLLAQIRKGGGSGDHANLNQCNAFLELSGHREFYRRGEAFPLILYRHL
jgi:molybdopterin molybdotransferase